MKIDKNYKNLIRLNNGNYYLEGNLNVSDDLIIELDDWFEVEQAICVGGSIISNVGIIARHGIEVLGSIEAGCGIEVGGCIKAGHGIKAGGCIKSGQSIEAGYSIIAGHGIEAGDSIKAEFGIEAGYGIKAGDGIEARYSIIAGDGIEAEYGINAGLSITAKWISSKLRIFAGLATWKNPSKEEMQINVEEVKEGEICFGELNIKEDNNEL